ncbi:MAG: hypothetical protein ACOC7R_04270 [Planctomycetota bacterium]
MPGAYGGAAEPEARLPTRWFSDAERSELDRRLAAYHSDPDQDSPWSIVAERIRSRK